MRSLPSSFLIGVSSSGHQVEGQNVHSDWWAFEQEGKVANGDRTGVASDYWNRYRDDVHMLRDLGVQAHRFGIEWARVEPFDGQFDPAALDRYADMVRAHKEAGIVPMVALYHFTMPKWMADRGGWMAPDIVDRLALYAERCAQRLGSEVEVYFTINEPLTLASLAYAFGLWPPQRRSNLQFIFVQRRNLFAHVAMARAVRRAVPGARVGLIKAWPRFRPMRESSWLDRGLAAYADWMFNGAFHHALRTGRMPPPLGLWRRVPGLRESIDVYGLNYYLFFLCDWHNPFVQRSALPGQRETQMGWGEDADGLRVALLRASQLGKPIMVTENGIATDDDTWRTAYVERHLEAVLDAQDAGVDVRAYLYWSFLDNFEWAEGWRPTFGLVELDHATLERRPRGSARWLGEVAQQRALLPAASTRGKG